MLPEGKSSLQCFTSTRNQSMYNSTTSTKFSQIMLSTSPLKIQNSASTPHQSNEHTNKTADGSECSSEMTTRTAKAKIRRILTNNISQIIEMTEPDDDEESKSSMFVLSKSQSDTISSLLAGLGSGTLSSIACAPLDLIRTRMQVVGDLKSNSNGAKSNSPKIAVNTNIIAGLRDIIATDGVRGCFRGLGPTLMTVPTFWGLYFPSYEFLKKDLYGRGIGRDTNNDNEDVDIAAKSGRVPPQVHMSAAIMAGAWADFFCNPMFVVRTRMQTEALHDMELPVQERKQLSISQTVKGLYHEGGIQIFWRGFSASLLGLSHVAIQFPAYEFFKAEARERSLDNQESALDLLLASGISKMIATSLTYPHEVVRSRMMDQRGSNDQVQGLGQTLMRIVKKEGISALYTGIHVSLVRVVPNCCITFMTYELILRWVKGNF